ncbi:MAG: ANTAR domain-containing protein [Gammaproteobacteria bacterium]|nr:ANTAR domain-containing protein [Gammaproteobacteria bacterium]
MPISINTIVISDTPQATKLLKSVLAPTDYKVIFESNDLTQQLKASWMIEPDLIIVAMEKTDFTLLGQLKTIYEQFPLPMVVFTQDDIDEGIEFAVEAGVNAYIVDGLRKNRVIPILKTACARFAKQQEVQKQIEQLRTSLADRKIIDRAKGLIMEQRNCSEDEAYKLLRTSAMKQNLRMAVLSKNIIDAATLLQSS